MKRAGGEKDERVILIRKKGERVRIRKPQLKGRIGNERQPPTLTSRVVRETEAGKKLRRVENVTEGLATSVSCSDFNGITAKIATHIVNFVGTWAVRKNKAHNCI